MSANSEVSSDNGDGSVEVAMGSMGQNAVVSDIAGPTGRDDAMEARSDMSGAAPSRLPPPQPQAREEDAPAPLAQSGMEEDSEARACNCLFGGEIRAPITFDPAGNIVNCVERVARILRSTRRLRRPP